MDDLLDRLNAVLGIKEPKKERVPQDVDRVTSPRIASERRALEDGAKQLGIDPRDYATAISYETAGTFDPWKAGPVTKWGQHRGTIQYGEPQRKQFGVYEGQPFEEQVTKSNVKYLKNAGVKPGMTFDQIYAAINGGSVNRNRNTQDADTGRTIADNIRIAQRDHRAKALKRYGWDDGDSATPAVDDLMERLNKVTQGITPDEAPDPLLERLNAVTATPQAENTPVSTAGKPFLKPEDIAPQLPPVNPTGVPLKTNATVMPAEQVIAEQPIDVQPQQSSVLQDRPQPFVAPPTPQIVPKQRRVAKGQPQPVQQAPDRRYEASEPQFTDVPEEVVAPPQQAIQRGQEAKAEGYSIQLPESIKTREEANKYITDTLRAEFGNVNIPEQYTTLNKDFTPGSTVKIDYDTLKTIGVDTDALVSQKIAENRIENPTPELGMKGLPKFSQVEKTEDELRDQYRKEEIAKLDPTSINRWINELIKNPFSRAMDAYDLATGQVTDIDKVVNERINALPQSGQGRRSVEQYNPENDAPFPVAKAASLGSNFYKGLVVDNFAPMLETAGYGQALFDNYILGKPTAVKDTSLFKSASAMRDTHEKGLAKMPDAFGEEQFTRTLGQAAGTMLMAATGASMVSPANLSKMTLIQQGALGIAQQSSEAYRTAIAKGATEDQARLAAMLAAPGGLVEGLSEAKIFSSLKRIQGLDLATNGKFSSQLMAKFKEISKSANEVGITELIEEGVQGLSSEVASQLAYRKNDRDVKGFLKDIDEMAKNAILAYPVGAILGGGTATAQIMAESGSEVDEAAAMPVSKTDALLKTEVPQKTEPESPTLKMGDKITLVSEMKASVSPEAKLETQTAKGVTSETQRDNSGNFEPPVKETKPEPTKAEQEAAIIASSEEIAKADAELEAARIKAETPKIKVEKKPTIQDEPKAKAITILDKPLSLVHGTSKANAESILRTGKLDPSKGKRHYDYSELGPDTVYLAPKESIWFKNPESGRMAKYETELPVTLKKGSKVFTVDSQASYAKLAELAGYSDPLKFQRDWSAAGFGKGFEKANASAVAISDKLRKAGVDVIEFKNDENVVFDNTEELLGKPYEKFGQDELLNKLGTPETKDWKRESISGPQFVVLNADTVDVGQTKKTIAKKPLTEIKPQGKKTYWKVEFPTKEATVEESSVVEPETDKATPPPNGTKVIRNGVVGEIKTLGGKTVVSTPSGVKNWSPDTWKPEAPMESSKTLDTITDSKGNIDYEAVKNVARGVESGEFEVTRLDRQGERGRIAGGQRNVEASIILATNERASEAAGSRTHPVKRQERLLEEYAKKEGIWFDVKEFVSQQQGYISKGVEAYVHRADGTSVHKLIDYKMIDRHDTPLDFIDKRITLFNHLFPETAYELVGFTRDGSGDFRFVVKQPFIQDVVYTTPTERQAFMRSKGFEMTDKYGEAFANDLYSVHDLHEKNALKAADGTIYVIDAVPKLRVEATPFEVVEKDAPLTRSREEMEASKESFKNAQNLEIPDLLKIVDVSKMSHDDGIIDMADVPEFELVRRVMGNAFGNKVNFDGIFTDPQQVKAFVKAAKELATQAKDAGFDGKPFSDLAKLVQEAAKANGTVIFYIADSALPEEKFHRALFTNRTVESRAKQIPTSTLNALHAMPVVQEALKGQFGKLYGKKSKAVQMEEFAVKSALGELEGVDKRQAAEVALRFLEAYAEHNQTEGVSKDDLLTKLATEITYGEEIKAIQREAEQNQASAKDSDKQAPDGEKDRPVSGERGEEGSTGVDQYVPSGETKLSQTPISAREKTNIPLKDEPYVSASNKEQQEFADKQLAKGVESATDWFKSQVADNNLNNGATGVVGLNLVNHYGMTGDLAKMNEVAELLVPAITEAAQSVQAMRVLSKFDPDLALTYATMRKVKATGQGLTDKEITRIAPKIEKLANAENEKNIVDTAVTELKQGINNADGVISDLEQTIKEANTQTTDDAPTVKKRVESTRAKVRPTPKKADRADIEARIRAAFNNELMESARGTDQTETANFKKWFKGSKVVDETGKPLVVYHGTDKDFDAFEQRTGIYRVLFSQFEVERTGFFFAEEQDLAKGYGDKIVPVFLSIENPVDWTKYGDTTVEDRLIAEKGYNPQFFNTGQAWEWFDGAEGKKLVQDLIDLGYDGVKMQETGAEDAPFGTAWVAFRPTQIKSATGNNGNFDPERNEIMESAREDFNDSVYQDLVDETALDILDYKTPAEIFNHLNLLTNDNVTPEQFVEIQLDGWRASKGAKDFTPTENLTTEQREAKLERENRRAARLANQRMAFAAQGKKVGPKKPNVFDREMREQGVAMGYTDAEIVGAILMPKMSGGKAVEDWYKQMKAVYPDADVDTFTRSTELRRTVLDNIQEQRLAAQAEKSSYEKSLPQFENEQRHKRIAVREAQGQLDREYERLQRGWKDVALSGLAETMGLFKGLTSWGEVSYILRQGFIPLLTDTRAAIKGDWEGIGHGLQGDNTLWKWAAGKGGFDEVADYLSNHSLAMFTDQIRQHPRFLEAQNNGVRFTQIGDFNIADDHFSTKILENVPLYKRAEVAYTLPGDLQRLYIYDTWAKGIDELGLTKEETQKAKKYAAETANAFTGKGDIGRVLARGGTLSKLASITFYSPQLLISRFQSAYRLTSGFATAPKGMKLQMAKKGARFYGTLGILMYLAGAVLDPEDDDFGKVNISKDSWLASKVPDARDLHIDMLAGLDLPIQNAMRLALGMGKAAVNRDIAYAGDAKDAVWHEMIATKQGEPRLARSKLSPGASLLVDIGKGTDFLGRPTTAWGAFTSRALPLAWQQTYDALLYDRLQAMEREPQTRENAMMKLSNEQKKMNALLMMLGTFTGVGLTQYPKDNPTKAMQLARTLSSATSNKDAETKRTEGALRNLMKAQVEAIATGGDVNKVSAEIRRFTEKYPALQKEMNKIMGQAQSETGLFSYYIKDLTRPELERVQKVATDKELEVVNKMLGESKKKGKSYY